MALSEAKSKNNHGSYYDAQAMYFALYSENKKAATLIAQEFVEKRILSQIQQNGSMPHELKRTRPLFYSIYNLHALFIVTHLAEKVDVDIQKNDTEFSRLQLGLEYLLPYTDQNKPWPHSAIGEFDRMEMFPILNMADKLFPERNYLNMINKLPSEKCKIHRAQLAFPTMR